MAARVSRRAHEPTWRDGQRDRERAARERADVYLGKRHDTAPEPHPLDGFISAIASYTGAMKRIGVTFARAAEQFDVSGRLEEEHQHPDRPAWDITTNGVDA